MSKTINISFDPELWEAVTDFAKTTRRSNSEIVRMALEEFLYNHFASEPFYTHKRLHKDRLTSQTARKGRG